MLIGDQADSRDAFNLHSANVNRMLVLSTMPSVLLGCFWNPAGGTSHMQPLTFLYWASSKAAMSAYEQHRHH